MRQLYDSIPGCPLPRLYGLSLLGTSLRVYVRETSTGEIKPTNGPTTGDLPLPHDFLEGSWDIDMLSQKGFDAMKEIVGEIVTGMLSLEPESVAVDGVLSDDLNHKQTSPSPRKPYYLERSLL
jgi:hypothetical protein